MITYTPRPGSKTEAAVAYLRANGGAATAIDLSEAIDTERKNLPAQLKAAIDHGLIESCDLADSMGYRLAGTDAPGIPRAPRAPSEKKEPSLLAIPAMVWPAAGADKKPVRQRRPKPGVGKNPGSARSPATGSTSGEARAVAAQATPRPAPEVRGLGPAPEPAAAGDVAGDAVDNPRHYTSHPSGIECIQITEHMGFNLGNAIKYLWRADLKGSGIEDLRKAAWYIARELQKRERAGCHPRESE